MPRYETVVFLQGSDYDEAMGITGGEDGFIVRQYADTWEALYDYLIQWEYGESTDDVSDTPPWSSDDDIDEDHPGYVVTWNYTYGHCSLIRVIEEDD